ncbi:MAG: type II secretion system F family protein, partial [Acetobacter sp.]|nr:type II secretion system F family protein [Acetobacter sp.]
MARQEVRNKRLIKLKKSVHLLKEGSFGAPQNFSEQAQTFFQDLGVWVEKKKLVSQKTLDTIKVGIGSKVFYRFLGAKLCSLVGGIFLFIFCGLLFGNWAFPMAFPVIGLVLPDMVMSRWRSRYIAKVQEGMADALDLMVICVEVGMPAEVAIGRVANEMELLHPAVAVELKLTVQDFQVIPDRIEVFRMLARRTGLPIMKQISSVLIQSIELGTPLGEAFRTLAD